MARVSLLEAPTIVPGGSGWAQLRLATPLAVAVGDRFVIRRPSPPETLGGGAVADISGERMRRRRDAVATLERRTAPTAASRLLAALDVPRTPDEAGGRSGLDATEPLQPPSPAMLESEYGIDPEIVAALAERGDLVRIGTEAVFLPDAVARFADAVVTELAAAGTITVARARDLTGSSRKHVLPLLGFLDDRGLTRRSGDDRILVVRPEQARERVATLIDRKKVAP